MGVAYLKDHDELIDRLTAAILPMIPELSCRCCLVRDYCEDGQDGRHCKTKLEERLREIIEREVREDVE